VAPGIRRDAGEMILREGQDAVEIEQAIKCLRHESGNGAHIYIRPAGLHSLSLIDDLTAEVIECGEVERLKSNLIAGAI
jgi:hypothetical protein